MAGRPAKPTHLKVLDGDDKKNPQRVNRSEPVPAEIEVVPPCSLSDEARLVWDRLAPDRIAKGVLTAWDVDAFALFCEALVIAHSRSRGAGAEAKPGAASPIAEFKTAVSIVTTLGSRFGWTPSDRASLRIEGGGGDEGKSPERLLG